MATKHSVNCLSDWDIFIPNYRKILRRRYIKLWNDAEERIAISENRNPSLMKVPKTEYGNVKASFLDSLILGEYEMDEWKDAQPPTYPDYRIFMYPRCIDYFDFAGEYTPCTKGDPALRYENLSYIHNALYAIVLLCSGGYGMGTSLRALTADVKRTLAGKKGTEGSSMTPHPFLPVPRTVKDVLRLKESHYALSKKTGRWVGGEYDGHVEPWSESLMSFVNYVVGDLISTPKRSGRPLREEIFLLMFLLRQLGSNSFGMTNDDYVGGTVYMPKYNMNLPVSETRRQGDYYLSGDSEDAEAMKEAKALGQEFERVDGMIKGAFLYSGNGPTFSERDELIDDRECTETVKYSWDKDRRETKESTSYAYKVFGKTVDYDMYNRFFTVESSVYRRTYLTNRLQKELISKGGSLTFASGSTENLLDMLDGGNRIKRVEYPARTIDESEIGGDQPHKARVSVLDGLPVDGKTIDRLKNDVSRVGSVVRLAGQSSDSYDITFYSNTWEHSSYGDKVTVTKGSKHPVFIRDRLVETEDGISFPHRKRSYKEVKEYNTKKTESGGYEEELTSAYTVEDGGNYYAKITGGKSTVELFWHPASVIADPWESGKNHPYYESGLKGLAGSGYKNEEFFAKKRSTVRVKPLLVPKSYTCFVRICIQGHLSEADTTKGVSQGSYIVTKSRRRITYRSKEVFIPVEFKFVGWRNEKRNSNGEMVYSLRGSASEAVLDADDTGRASLRAVFAADVKSLNSRVDSECNDVFDYLKGLLKKQGNSDYSADVVVTATSSMTESALDDGHTFPYDKITFKVDI